jgi:hypothetical protein
MSDSVKKYKEDFPTNYISVDERRENDTLELITKAVKAGKIAQITERVEKIQKELKGASLYTALQLACDEFEV